MKKSESESKKLRKNATKVLSIIRTNRKINTSPPRIIKKSLTESNIKAKFIDLITDKVSQIVKTDNKKVEVDDSKKVKVDDKKKVKVDGKDEKVKVK